MDSYTTILFPSAVLLTTHMTLQMMSSLIKSLVTSDMTSSTASSMTSKEPQTENRLFFVHNISQDVSVLTMDWRLRNALHLRISFVSVTQLILGIPYF